jgi:hypothetical protein
LRVAWEASDFICAERLQPFLPELVPMLTRPGDLVLEPHIQELLLTASISTVERNLRPLCLEYRGRRCQHSRPGSALRKEIPVVVTSRDIDIPSYLEIDLVSHSGDYAAGEWVHTLTATDTSPPAGPSGFRSWQG